MDGHTTVIRNEIFPALLSGFILKSVRVFAGDESKIRFIPMQFLCLCVCS